MPLTAGSRIGPYEVVAAIGAGGMGEVYRARDTRLERDVAIKIVPELFASDPDRLVRFEREAKTLASLNHPNIAHIHGIEGADIVRALVMEFVDGEDLAQRIARGPIPAAEALAIARQIADALEAAHERGVIHRDLKPANIKVRDDGTVKVLDFGLSKAMDLQPAPTDPSLSPTFTSPATQLGVILGTAAYMAPEQAKGKQVDKRVDIWAFGVVLFEMLSGKSPFAGETTTDVLSHIISRDPDWGLLPADTPPGVRQLLKHCLERDPKRRLRDIGDARFEASEIVPVTSPAAKGWGPLVAALAVGAVALAVGLAAGWMLHRAPARTAEPVRRFGLGGISPIADPWQTVTISPDGRNIAYRGFDAGGIDRLFVRSLDSIQPIPVAGSEGGRLPFFSHDSARLAFFSAGQLRQTTLGTGSPLSMVALTGIPLGGTWLDDGSIVFVDAAVGLMRVPPGATKAEVLRPRELGDVVTPWALPGGRGILLGVRDGTEGRVGLFSLTDKSLRILVQDGFMPAWSASGGLLFGQGNSIVRLPFDIERLTATGPAEPIVNDARARYSMQSRLFGVADDGTLAYLPATSAAPAQWSLVWVDRSGRESPITGVSSIIDSPRLSPDGTRIVFRRTGPNCDLWAYDMVRGVITRLTLEGDNHGAVYTADGERVVFARVGNPPMLLSVPVGGGTPQHVAAGSRLTFAKQSDVMVTSWLPRTGELLVRSGTDTFLVSPTAEPKPLGQPAFEDSEAVFSPDGSQIAYVSDESGRLEVYVQPHPGPGPRVQVSSEGGSEPVWAASGKELFFRHGQKILAVDVKSAGSFGRPRQLFSANYMTHTVAANYDVARDGSRFVMVKGPFSIEHDQIIVVLGAVGESRGR
jgi:Tol biopolymer transport system component